jgi:hypothetical protein
MPTGLVITIAVENGARNAAHPAEAAGARCKPPGQIPGLAAADAAGGDMVSTLTASDLQAAGPRRGRGL